MRIAAHLLTGALEEFAGVLKGWFPRTTPTMSDLLAAYAIDHGYDPSKTTARHKIRVYPPAVFNPLG